MQSQAELGGDGTISEEFLQNLQTAVGSAGVIGQVQVIETENGPMTVIIMEEGAETGATDTTTTQVVEQQVMEAAGDGQQYQYEVVQEGMDYTTQVLDTGQQLLPQDGLTSGSQASTTAGHVYMSEGQVFSSDEQVITSDGQVITTDGQVVTSTEGQVGCSDGQVIVTDGQVIPSEKQIITPDGQMITSDGQVMSAQGQLMTTDGQIITTGGQILTADGQVISGEGVTYQTTDGQVITSVEQNAPSEHQALTVAYDASQSQYAVASQQDVGIEQQPPVEASQDTYYITETGEIVKIDSNQVVQQGYSDSTQLATDNSIVQTVYDGGVPQTSTVEVYGQGVTSTAVQAEYTAVKLADPAPPEVLTYSTYKQPVMRSIVNPKIKTQPKKFTPAKNTYTHAIVSKTSASASSQTYTSQLVQTERNQLTTVYPSKSVGDLKKTIIYPKFTKQPPSAKNIKVMPKTTYVTQSLSQTVTGGKGINVVKPKELVKMSTSRRDGYTTYVVSQPGQKKVQTFGDPASAFKITPKQTVQSIPLKKLDATKTQKPPIKETKPAIATILTNQFLKKTSEPAKTVTDLPSTVSTSVPHSRPDKIPSEGVDFLSNVIQAAQMELTDTDVGDSLGVHAPMDTADSPVEPDTTVEEPDKAAGGSEGVITVTRAEEEALAATLAEFLTGPGPAHNTENDEEEGVTSLLPEKSIADVIAKAPVTSGKSAATSKVKQTGTSWRPPVKIPVSQPSSRPATVLKAPPSSTQAANTTQASRTITEADSSEKPDTDRKPDTTTTSPSKTKMKSIDVPDSDVTIQLYADGTLVTKDRSGTNYSKVRLEDLGLDQDMLAGNTDIELLIVQGDGREVRATLNTNILHTEEDGKTPATDTGKSQVKVSDVSSPVKAAGSTQKEMLAQQQAASGNELRPYKCSMCPRTFKFYRTFRCHEIVHTKADIFTCHLCKRVFARETNLASHLELHQKKAAMGLSDGGSNKSKEGNKKLSFICSRCGVAFNNAEKLKQHNKLVHPKPKKPPKPKEEVPKKFEVCPICDRLFASPKILERHSGTHAGPFLCCEKKYEVREAYVEHLEEKHPQKLLTCPSCQKVMITKQDYQSHVKFHHQDLSEDEKNTLLEVIFDAECHVCGKKMSKFSLQKHLTDVHMEDDVCCTYCEYRCTSETKLKKHLKAKHGVTALEKCEKCDEEFPNKFSVIEHMKIEHAGPYPCTECTDRFDSRSDCEKHQYEKHEGGFTCLKCNLKFMYSKELKQHFDDHDPGSQKFLCNYCGTGFELQAQMRTHLVKLHFKGDNKEMVKAHPDMKKVPAAYVCQICGEYDFELRTTYIKHLRDTHFSKDFNALVKVFPSFKKTPEPPASVECKKCGRTFGQPNHLKIHMRTHARGRKPDTTTNESESEIEEDEDEEVNLSELQPRDMDKNYPCSKCKQSFSRKAALEKHMSSQHSKDRFKEALDEIEKDESERAELEEVMEMSSVDTELTKSPRRKSAQIHVCTVCEVVFKSRQELRQHDQEEHGEDSGAALEDQADAHDTGHTSHDPTVNTDETMFDLNKKLCKICKKSFASKKGTRKHMKFVHKFDLEPGVLSPGAKGLEVYKCYDCNKAFSLPMFLNQHIQNKHQLKGKGKKMDTSTVQDSTPAHEIPTEVLSTPTYSGRKRGRPRKVETDEDYKAMITPTALLDTETEGTERETNDITAFLGRNFNLEKKSAGVGNMDSVKKKVYKCSTCTMTFSREATLRKHQETHHDGGGGEFVTGKMEVDTDSLDSLQMPMYGCPNCGNMYSTSSGLLYHTKTKHADIDEQSVIEHIDKIDEQLRSLGLSPTKLPKKLELLGRKRKLSIGDETEDSAMKKQKMDPTKIKSPQTSSSPAQYSQSGRKITNTSKQNEQIRCPVCNRLFDMEGSLKRHLKMSHGSSSFSPDSSSVKKDPDGETKHTCQVCGKVFFKERGLKRHMIVHNSPTKLKRESGESGSMIYECDVCCEKFAVFSSLRDHMATVHDEDEECETAGTESQPEKLTCDICHAQFATQAILNNHRKNHEEGNKEMAFICCLCSQIYAMKTKLELHLRRKHPKDWIRKVKCRTCLALFDNERAMKKHSSQHHGLTDTDGSSGHHKCEECKKVFKWQKNLDSHVKYFHDNSATKTCGVCNKVFPNDKMIDEHMKTHQAEFSCQLCEKSFKKKLGLTMHNMHAHKIKIESDVKFSCDICMEAFASKAKLLQHMLTHTSLLSVKCNKCGQSFKQEQALKSHKCEVAKSLTKDKPTNAGTKSSINLKFNCKKCTKKFSTVAKLNAHKAVAHKTSYAGIKLAKKKKEQVFSGIRTRRQSSIDSNDSSKDAEPENSTEKIVKNLVKTLPSSLAKKSVGLEKSTKPISLQKKSAKSIAIGRKSKPAITEKKLQDKPNKSSLKVTKRVSEGGSSNQKTTPKPSLKATPKIKSAKSSPSTSSAKSTPRVILKSKSTPKSAKESQSVTKDAKSGGKSTPKFKCSPNAPSLKPVPCPVCGKVLSKRSKLKHHLQHVHQAEMDEAKPSPTERVQCLYCNECAKMFWSQSNYDAHIKQKHPDKAALELDKEVIKQLIKKEILSPKQVDSQDQGDLDQDFQTIQHKCEFCGAVFETKSMFHEHLLEFHRDHAAEYGISAGQLLGQAEMEGLSDAESSNVLNVEVYKNMRCNKLTTSPVVMLEKMTQIFDTEVKVENKETDEGFGTSEAEREQMEDTLPTDDASMDAAVSEGMDTSQIDPNPVPDTEAVNTYTEMPEHADEGEEMETDEPVQELGAVDAGLVDQSSELSKDTRAYSPDTLTEQTVGNASAPTELQQEETIGNAQEIDQKNTMETEMECDAPVSAENAENLCGRLENEEHVVVDSNEGSCGGIINVVSLGEQGSPGELCIEQVANTGECRNGSEDIDSGVQHGGEDIDSSVQHGGEDIDSSVQHSNEDIDSYVQHGGEDIDSSVQHSGENIDSGVQHSGENIDSGVQHSGENIDSGVQHGGEDIDSSVQHGGEDIDSGVQHGGEDIDSGVQHSGEDIDSGVQHGGENIDSGVQQSSEQCQEQNDIDEQSSEAVDSISGHVGLVYDKEQTATEDPVECSASERLHVETESTDTSAHEDVGGEPAGLAEHEQISDQIMHCSGVNGDVASDSNDHVKSPDLELVGGKASLTQDKIDTDRCEAGTTPEIVNTESQLSDSIL